MSVKRSSIISDSRGATLVEYALAAAILVAAFAVAALVLQTAAITAQNKAVAPHTTGGAPRYTGGSGGSGLTANESF